MVSKSDSAGEGSALPTDTVKSSSLPVSMELDAPAHSAESEKLQKRGKKKSKRSKATSSKKLTEAVHKDVENVPEIVKERNKMVGITSVHDRWMSHIAKSRSHWFFDNFMRNVERGSRPRGATKGEAQGFTCVADMAGDITLNGVLTTSDSQYLVGFKSVTVVVYSVANGEKVLSFSVSNWITAIALHATTPSLLYVATTDGMISLWNILNGTMVNYWNVGHHVLSLVQSPKLPETLFAWVGKVDVDNVPQPKALYEQCVYAFSLQDTKDHTVQEQYLAGGRNFYDLALSPTGEFLGILSHREVEVFQIQASLQQGELPTKLTISLRDEGARLLFGPEPDCLTVGHYQGRFTRFKLNTNMNLLDSYTRIHSVHWFPSEIQSMDYLKEDNSLLICGLHFVAVIYKLDTNTFRFVSGLGVGIRQLLVTKDQRNMVFVLNTGSIHFITPQQLSSRAAIHGLRVSPEIPVSAFTVTSPPRLVVHPSTQYVMLNTIFSSLQLYDPLTDQGISEISLDTVSIHTGDTALNREPGKIGSVAFSGDGEWLAVFVAYQAQSLMIESQLQFWRYDSSNQTFIGPNTRIRVADSEPITQVAFQPVHSRTIQGNFQAPFVATTSASGDIKLWECKIREQPSQSKSKKPSVTKFWVQRSALSFEGEGTPLLAFSSDGSVLAAVYQSVVTLWDPYTGSLQRCLSRFPMLENIQSAQFAGPTPYLVTHSSSKVTVWSLLTSKVWWEVSCTPQLVAVHPNAGLFAVVDQNDSQATIKVYHVSHPVPLSINKISDKLQSLVFITRRLAHPNEHGLATHQEIYPVQHTPADPRVVQGDKTVDRTTLAQSSLVGLTESGNVVVYAYPTKDKPLGYHPSMILFKRLDDKADTEDRRRVGNTLYFENVAEQVTPTKALLDSLYGDLRFGQVQSSDRVETQSRFQAQQRLLKQNVMLDTPAHLLPGVGDMFKAMVTHALLPAQSPSDSQQTPAGPHDNHTGQSMDTDDIHVAKSLVPAKPQPTATTVTTAGAQSADNSAAELFMWPTSDKTKVNTTNTPDQSTLNTESLTNYFAQLLSH